jgi:putative addiction module killer protein
MKEKELLEFVTETGRPPFREWLIALKDVQVRSRIRVRLNRIRLGNLGDCKSVGDGVFEIRMNFGPGYRVYFGHEGQSVIILLCGGDKKSQGKDILLAKRYWASFKSRISS